MRKILILILLLPLLASCGWSAHCTKRTTYNLAEEKEAVVGAEMVQTGCFSVLYEPTGLNRGLWNKKDQEDITIAPMPEKELIYSGRAGDILHITYREYMHRNYIKPAFTQHVQYDLKTSDMVYFKDWAIKVLDANNQMIRFKVVKDPVLGEWYF